jgi:hypothetical protein
MVGERNVTYSVPREVNWIKEGTVPSRLLNDISLLISNGLLPE